MFSVPALVFGSGCFDVELIFWYVHVRLIKKKKSEIFTLISPLLLIKNFTETIVVYDTCWRKSTFFK